MTQGYTCCVGIMSERISLLLVFFLKVACAGGFASVCSSLIRKGKADVQDRSPVNGWVALHIAALKGMSVLVE